MSSYKVIGELTYSSTRGEIKWEIPNYVGGAALYDGIWDSPSFYILNSEWCLRIADKVIDGIRWESLYLVMQTSSSEYLVTFTFNIGYLNGLYQFQFGPETRFFDKSGTSHGKENFVTVCGLQTKLRSQKVSSLVIYCHVVKPLQCTASQTSLLNSITISCRDFQDLLLSGRNSDLTVAVGDEEFKAHKLVLEAYSPVFAAMFDDEMAQKERNVIKVEDCDPDAFRYFLQCVYAGRIDSLSVDKAIPLYMISHKYDVKDILEKCARYLTEELNEDTVCNILALANRYNEADLKKAAEEFMAQNMNKIFSTNSWSTMAAENSLLKKYSSVSRDGKK